MSTETTKTVEQNDVAARIEARVEARKAAWKEKVAKAEELKTIGNELFKRGEYFGAAEHYFEAYELNFTQPNYLSNLAATLIKTEEYDFVEYYTTLALVIQPRHLKARYRRLQGRKAQGLFKSALNDARALLRLEPENAEAKNAVQELEAILEQQRQIASESGTEGSEWVSDDGNDQDHDNLNDAPNETEQNFQFCPEDWSDTEDSVKVGNKIPCRHYNHLGCLRGAECNFAHSTDKFSVRDRLAALPPNGWWNDPEGTRTKAKDLRKLGKSGVLRKEILNKRKKWWREADKERNPPQPSTSSSTKNFAKDKKQTKWKCQRSHKNISLPPDISDDSGDEYEYGIFGMSRSDDMELLSHGVKPWDEDAFVRNSTTPERQIVKFN